MYFCEQCMALRALKLYTRLDSTKEKGAGTQGQTAVNFDLYWLSMNETETQDNLHSISQCPYWPLKKEMYMSLVQ